jgi:Family of unknown function (DUF6116)
MGFGRGTVVGWIVARLARLRFPTLFLLTGAVFLVNVVIPDAIPFVDELLLGLATALLGSLRARKSPAAEAPPAARAR